MKEPKHYATPEAFKRALEDRIKTTALEENTPVNRFRQRLVFDRFLARVAMELGDAAIAKGGLALELRLGHARTTRDVDLRVTGDRDAVLDSLQRAGRLDMGDHLQFTIALAPDGQETIEGEGVVYEGIRFRAEAALAPDDVHVDSLILKTSEDKVTLIREGKYLYGTQP